MKKLVAALLLSLLLNGLCLYQTHVLHQHELILVDAIIELSNHVGFIEHAIQAN
jgi:hypothetical protein